MQASLSTMHKINDQECMVNSSDLVFGTIPGCAYNSVELQIYALRDRPAWCIHACEVYFGGNMNNCTGSLIRATLQSGVWHHRNISRNTRACTGL